MYPLSIGVHRMDEILPAEVYAVLSRLNASTVGIIALTGVQLAEKAIRDKLSRVLVIIGLALVYATMHCSTSRCSCYWRVLRLLFGMVG